MNAVLSGYARFDARHRLSLGRYADVLDGDYAQITKYDDGTILIKPVPFPKGA